jgi:hypothetical protein
MNLFCRRLTLTFSSENIVLLGKSLQKILNNKTRENLNNKQNKLKKQLIIKLSKNGENENKIKKIVQFFNVVSSKYINSTNKNRKQLLLK